MSEVTRLARAEIAWDLDGSLKIQTCQRRVVFEREGKPPVELELLPTELLFVANPTPQDVTADLAEALGEVNAALLAELAAAKEERDRLRIIVDTYAAEVDSALATPAIAAEEAPNAEPTP